MLFVFALMSSGYVLYVGLQKKEKTTHEILLKCVIIITSVVPRQFPMQMAMAVNMALMALTKSGIFCTEPFRVPMAGKITHILFDKTGTLTTDQLVPVGVVNAVSVPLKGSSNKEIAKKTDSPDQLVPVIEACGDATMVLAACHSLVSVVATSATDSNNNHPQNTTTSNDDDASDSSNKDSLAKKELVGDPIELAAMKGAFKFTCSALI